MDYINEELVRELCEDADAYASLTKMNRSLVDVAELTLDNNDEGFKTYHASKYTCSNCEKSMPVLAPDEHEFCSNCGAKVLRVNHMPYLTHRKEVYEEGAKKYDFKQF